MTPLQEQWEKVGKVLQDYTYMFYKVWSMGMPVFDDSIPTAGVGFDRANGHLITFRFNPKFWDKCTQYQRAFVVAHEALHVILNHGVRGLNANFQELSNIAMDIPINHMLVDDYGFDRNKLGFFSKDFCWRDTVFSADKNIVPLADQSYEYYYSLLERNASFVIMPNSFDDHSGLGNIPSDVLDRLPNDVKQEIEDAQQKDGSDKNGPPNSGRGNGAGDSKDTVATEVVEKRTWVQIFQHLAKTKMKAPDINEQWARLHKRMQFLDPRIMIPSEFHEEEAEAPEKISIHLFLDVSGSCWDMRSTFTKAYNSIPKELFDIKLFQFDTQVLPVTIRKDGALDFIGGGGTYFENIERFLLGTHPVGTDTKKKYPEVVVVFTDGDGGRVQPKHPDRWYWFLDSRGHNWNGRNYFASKLPKKSHVHYLEDVVPD